LNKVLFIFSFLIIKITIFALISFLINLSFLNRIKKTSSMKNLIFGLQITLIGITSLYIVWNYTFHSIFWGIAMWFIPIYLITTGFTFGLIGYLDKSNT